MRYLIHPCDRILRCFSIAIFAATAIATIQPIQVDFGPNFLGDDGQWSPAQIRVGTSPEQWLLLFPNTLSSETWVIGPAGCDTSQTCTLQRGGIFYWNQSSTWDELGYFDLDYQDVSGAASIGQYGLDNVSVSDIVSVGRQPIAIVNSTSLWLGQFGLNVQEPRFNDNVEHIPFLSTLVQNLSLIPSHSYGYTAGAPYALKGVAGSLTLGGVDTTRFTSTSASFSLSSNYEPIVTIKSIQVASAVFGETTIPFNWNSNPVTLLESSDAFTATIDTSTPFLWMPAFVCDAFATALNLTYDANLDLYVFPTNSSAQILKSWGLTFTFTLSNLPNSTITFNLPISYNAFNLQLTYPFPGLNATSNSPAVDYFPLRRANLSSQYVIGRAFLQETYLTVDYERNAFSVFPAVFPDLNKDSPNLVPITRPTGSLWPGPQSPASSSLSTGAKAGIGIGVALAILGVGGLVYLWLKKRSDVQNASEKSEIVKKRTCLGIFGRRGNPKTSIPELLGDKQHPREMHADASNSRFEIGGDVPSEMPAGEVPSTYYEANHDIRESAVARNDPRRPAELGHREPTSKQMMVADTAARERSQSPVPPYSPSDNSHGDQRLSNSISPNSIRNNNPFSGSESSGEQGISPVTPSLPANRRFTAVSGQALLNPVSPMMHSHTESTTQSSTQSSHLAPSTGAPARTISRNSRFREELVDDAPQLSANADDSRRVRARYSWEE